LEGQELRDQQREVMAARVEILLLHLARNQYPQLLETVVPVGQVLAAMLALMAVQVVQVVVGQ
jgi:hypothetical protein